MPLLVTCNMSLVTCHLSLVTCHLSLVTCHVSLVTCHSWSRIPRASWCFLALVLRSWRSLLQLQHLEECFIMFCRIISRFRKKKPLLDSRFDVQKNYRRNKTFKHWNWYFSFITYFASQHEKSYLDSITQGDNMCRLGGENTWILSDLVCTLAWGSCE